MAPVSLPEHNYRVNPPMPIAVASAPVEAAHVEAAAGGAGGGPEEPAIGGAGAYESFFHGQIYSNR